MNGSTNLRLLFLLPILLAPLLLAACAGADAEPSERGRDPWVFRSVLDWQPRMTVLALRDDFWAAYDAERGALHKVWKEGVEFDGPVYTTAHGPQPISLGDAYLVSPDRMPWRVLRGGQAAEPRVAYRGHRFEDGRAVLMYDLVLNDGTRIAVTESPEYVEDGGRPGLERVFTTEGVPEGAEVALDVHLNSLADAESYTTDGRFESAPAGAEAVRDGRLVLAANGTTRFTAYFGDEPLVPAEEPVRDEDKPAGLRLIEGSDCQACHNAEVKTVGPSYRAIAERYETTPATIAMLASRIREGGSGNWTELVGPAIMTPHPDLQPADAEAMVRYILALDGEEAPSEGTNGASAEEEETDDPLADMGRAYPLTEPPEDAAHGLAVNVWRFPGPLSSMPAPRPGEAPVYSGVVPALHLPDAEAYGEFDEYFYVNARGTIDIPETTNYVFRLASDDGGKLFIDGKEIIDHDGLHGPTAIDGEVFLEAGPHPIEVQYFQGGGGKALSLQWIAHGQDAFTVIQPSAFTYDAADLRETAPYEPPEPLIEGIPGDAHPLIDVHPSFRVETIRPDGFEPKVGGLGFLPDGRLVVSTWDADGSVYAVSNLDAEDRADIGVKRIAAGLLEPLGLTVVDGDVYVLQKHELTRLIDHDGDDVIDEYRTVADDWGATSNFHEFAFGLVYQDGYFYAALATAILPGGASASPQNPDRGKVVKIGKDDGSVAFVAHGLRTPNGIGLGRGGELFVADNQGDWLPSSKIVHVREGAFFGNRAVDPEGTATMEEDPPVVWLPQDEIGNSPSTPVGLDVGPYQGQLIHGEVTHGGIKRVFVEEVDGRLQGAVFRFTQGLEAGVNRIAWGPDDKLYVGGIGNPGNWGHYGKNWYGLQRMSYTGAPVFEMLAVRARSNGLEIEFTEPLPVNAGGAPADYEVRQWRYQPTAAYGGPKVDEAALPVRSVALSEDRTRVFLEVPDVEAGHVVYLRIRAPLVSQEGRALWSTEAWYTMNALPGEAGPTFAATAPYEAAAPNTLTEAERAAGWRLLFDGQTLDGWHAYGGGAPGAAWKIQDGTLTLDGTRPDTAWQYTDGGDLVTDDAFEDFELHLEWKIAEGGNSGIIYNVQEAPEYDYVWETGPEMQILDNARHPDGQIRTHRAGDLYDLIESPYVATRPVGEWNTVRLVQRDGRVEHWLNGHKIVEVDMTSDAWRALVAGSKFNEMPAFGKAVQGRIALQDHGDRVWFRNIKIRAL